MRCKKRASVKNGRRCYRNSGGVLFYAVLPTCTLVVVVCYPADILVIDEQVLWYLFFLCILVLCIFFLSHSIYLSIFSRSLSFSHSLSFLFLSLSPSLSLSFSFPLLLFPSLSLFLSFSLPLFLSPSLSLSLSFSHTKVVATTCLLLVASRRLQIARSALIPTFSVSMTLTTASSPPPPPLSRTQVWC